MERHKKRERGANFSREETDKLITLIQVKKHIIENKKSDATVWHDKEKAWQDLEKKFNSYSTEIYRSAKHLKLKYEALKRDTRRKSSISRSELCNLSSRKASPLTAAEQKVKDMILLSVTNSDQAEAASEDQDSDIPDHDPIFIEANVPVDVKKPLSCNSNETKPFEMLEEATIETEELQRTILLEELETKKLKKLILQAELKHKETLFQLEKEQMLLKIKILNTELENNRQIL